VEDARLEAFRRVERDADRLGNLVRGLEPDPPDLTGEAVRLLADDPPAVVAESLVDPHRQRGRGAVALQRGHHLTDVPLLHPCSRDAARADLADAGHLGYLTGIPAIYLEDARRCPYAGTACP